MLDINHPRCRRSSLVVGVLLVVLGPSTLASAYGVVRRGSELRCEPRGLSCESAAGCEPGELCTQPDGLTLGVCLRPNDVLCLTSATDRCLPFSSPRLIAGVEICVPDRGDLGECTELLGCFLDDADTIVRFSQGDCDFDGVPNTREAPGQLCIPAPPLGVVDEGSCESAALCLENADCDDGTVCREDDLARHSYCLPPFGEDTTYCCDEDTECADEPCVLVGEESVGLCGAVYCPTKSFAFRLNCFVGIDGVPQTDPDLGDCDGDGLTNEAEASAEPGSECDPEGVELDGGLADAGPTDGGMVDAGEMDAGTNDAGSRDAGRLDGAADDASSIRDREVNFGGGGGCVCRATPSSSSSAGGFVGLALLLLWGVRRRHAG